MFVNLDDYNRVKLDMVDMPEYTDYVNASYIHVTSDIFLFLDISKQMHNISYKFNFEYKRLLEKVEKRLKFK